jgi:hypothetical protein
MITGLNAKGIPTPLTHTYLRAPQSRMDILSTKEIDTIISRSALIDKYNENIDRESAYEILTAKIEDAQSEEVQEKHKTSRRKTKREDSTLEKMSKNTAVRQIGRTVARELTRGLLGVLGVKTTRRRSTRKRSGWF